MPSNSPFNQALVEAKELASCVYPHHSSSSKARPLADMALADPQGIGDFGDWIRTLRPNPWGDEADSEDSQRFVQALCERLFEQEDQWLDLALERASQADAQGLFFVIQALFLPQAAREALSPYGVKSAAESRWERSRWSIVANALDLCPAPLVERVRELALESSLSRSGVCKSFTHPESGAPAAALALFLSPEQASQEAISFCSSAHTLTRERFNDYLPLALQAQPDFLTSGVALGLSKPPDFIRRLPEAFVSASLARDLLRAWRPQSGAWANVSNGAYLAKWASFTELAIEEMVARVPKKASWTQSLQGHFLLQLPNQTMMSFTLLGPSCPAITPSDCALLCGRDRALAVFSKRFGPPSMDRLFKLATHLEEIVVERQALALRDRLIEIEARQIAEATSSAQPAATARRPRI